MIQIRLASKTVSLTDNDQTVYSLHYQRSWGSSSGWDYFDNRTVTEQEWNNAFLGTITEIRL